MKISDLSRLALKHAQNSFNEQLYLSARFDVTRPVKIIAIINERCNYRCRYCDFWRLENYQDELSIEQWKAGLQSLKDFVGTFHVEFSGGEPFIKKGFLDLLEWCRDAGINFGVTTNGSPLNPKITSRLVATRPFNVNISIDSYQASVHDYTRGIAGSLQHLSTAIPRLREEQRHQGVHFPVIVKPTVTSANFRALPKLANWATRELGATVVNFQPVDRWTKETDEELWIEENNHEELQAIANELIAMKRNGVPIMNSELTMGFWVKHFRNEKAPAEAMPCRIGLRNYTIRTNGDVEVCWYWPAIGNITRQSAEDIWKSAEARKRREETIACDRLCLFSCLSTSTFQDKVRTGMKLLIESSRKTSTARALPVESAE